MSARIGRRRGAEFGKNGGIRRKKIPRNSRRKKTVIPAEKNPSFPPKTRKTPVIPANAGIHYGRLILEFRKTAKIHFGIPAFFSHKTAGMTGIYRRKWIPAFAGMTAGRAGILSAKITAAGEIPIYIGMVKNDGVNAGNKIGDF